MLNLVVHFFDLSRTDTAWNIFQVVLQSNVALPVGVIQQVVGLPMQTVSRILTEYHKAGFMMRQESGRRVLYAINTEAYAQVVTEMNALLTFRQKIDKDNYEQEHGPITEKSSDEDNLPYALPGDF